MSCDDRTTFTLEENDCAAIVRANGDRELFIPKMLRETGDRVENETQGLFLTLMNILVDDSKEAAELIRTVMEFYKDE